MKIKKMLNKILEQGLFKKKAEIIFINAQTAHIETTTTNKQFRELLREYGVMPGDFTNWLQKKGLEIDPMTEEDYLGMTINVFVQNKDNKLVFSFDVEEEYNEFFHLTFKDSYDKKIAEFAQRHNIEYFQAQEADGFDPIIQYKELTILSKNERVKISKELQKMLIKAYDEKLESETELQKQNDSAYIFYDKGKVTASADFLRTEKVEQDDIIYEHQ